MSLENYLAKASVSYSEIQWDFSLEPEEVQKLYNRAKEIGYTQYLDFVQEHRIEIVTYIGLSPSQRQQKKWINHPEKLLIRLAALQICDAASSLLLDIRGVASVVDSGSYRKFQSIVCDGVSSLLLTPFLSLFPFEGFESPF